MTESEWLSGKVGPTERQADLGIGRRARALSPHGRRHLHQRNHPTHSAVALPCAGPNNWDGTTAGDAAGKQLCDAPHECVALRQVPR
jgi:hypothetical protein